MNSIQNAEHFLFKVKSSIWRIMQKYFISISLKFKNQLVALTIIIYT